MKKFFLFASAALVLASCSSEAEEAVIKPNETPEEEVADLVAIKIGGSRASASSEASTRAANVIDDFNDTKIGIFAVDEATIDPFAVGSVATNGGKAWASNGVAATATVILNNIPAKAAAPAGGSASTVTLFSSSDDSNYPAKWYYPRSVNSYCYTFIGYYPFSETTAISDNEITISGIFDGSQDVMIGRADSKKSEKGYNAKWYRDQSTSQVPAPGIKFNHQTAQVVLHIKQGNGDPLPDNNVVEAYFVGEPTTYTLKIDRNGNPSIEWGTSFGNAYAIGEVFDNKKVYKAGALVKDANIGGNLYKINEPGFNGDGSSAISSVAAQVTNGIAPESSSYTDYPVFISANGERVKKLHVVLQDGTETDIDITAPAEHSTFDPGYKYTVLLTIHGPQQIEVSATVSAWNTVSEEITGAI